MSCPDKTMAGRILDYDRFQLLWRRCLLDKASDESAAIHARLIASYSEPQRYYHTLVHIEHCLSLFDKISHKLQNAAAVELAIWFHDVVYQPDAIDNEQLSANLFMATTNGIFDDTFRNTVYQHVMATSHNGSEIKNADTKYLVDIDLSSFGQPWAEFIFDSNNLRLEMEGLSDKEFYQRKVRFLKKLFSQPRFFKSDYFYNKYETQARQNQSDYFEIIGQKLKTGR